jgi:hypothetical protein
MAIYKLFPDKDATIVSNFPTQNQGRDEILEIGTYNGTSSFNTSAQGTLPAYKRSLIQFNSTEINNVLSNKVGDNDFSASLRLFLANAEGIPLDYNIFCAAISQSWNMGTGRSHDLPKTIKGCSWQYTQQSGKMPWATSGYEPFVTASFSSSIAGGGTWYYDGTNLIPTSSQNFTYTSNKDINLDVKPHILMWNSGTIANDGFILKLDEATENGENLTLLKYFSVDTHTIYPPTLEIKWDDSIWNSTATVVTSSEFVAKLTNLKSEFEDSSVYKFKIKARDTFPTRAFQTTSVYLNTKILPTSSYWGLKDVKTEEMVVDFDTQFTKLSANNNENYFTLYMDGLEPERYYQVLIKTIVEGEIIILDDESNYFKLVR